MSSSRFNSISISVTNEDNGDLEEKARVRARIKRKKLGFRGKTDVLLRIITMIVKWWMILIFLLAILLLLIEASRIAGKAKEEVKSDFSLPSRNLNHLNPMTGNVNASNNVNETAVVHCGFYSDNGGFRISDGDRSYMQTCEAVVSTCAFGGGDDLYQPIGMTEASLRKVCFVAFWDEITHSTQEAEGKRIGEGHLIGRWHIVVVMDLPFTDQRLNGKIPKTLSHRLFPRAWFSIWVDSKSQFRRDPLGVLEALLWHTNSVLAISEHGARSDIYDEGKAIVNKHKVTPEEVEVQLSQYCRDGHPEDKRFNGKRGNWYHPPSYLSMYSSTKRRY